MLSEPEAAFAHASRSFLLFSSLQKGFRTSKTSIPVTLITAAPNRCPVRCLVRRCPMWQPDTNSLSSVAEACLFDRRSCSSETSLHVTSTFQVSGYTDSQERNPMVFKIAKACLALRTACIEACPLACAQSRTRKRMECGKYAACRDPDCIDCATCVLACSVPAFSVLSGPTGQKLPRPAA